MAPRDEPARATTLRHLRKLMAAAAAIGVAAVTTRSSGAPEDASAATAAPSGVDTDGGEAGVRPEPPIGYAVVDPLPPPARGCGCGHGSVSRDTAGRE